MMRNASNVIVIDCSYFMNFCSLSLSSSPSAIGTWCGKSIHVTAIEQQQIALLQKQFADTSIDASTDAGTDASADAIKKRRC